MQIHHNIKILFEDNHIIVAYKPKNILSQQDYTNDLDILTYLKNYIKVKYNKPNEVFLGLLHRLDRMTDGVMVFARTSKAASRISEDIKNNRFYKEYIAIVEGIISTNGTIELKLSKDEKNNKSYVDKNGKIAILDYEVVENYKNKSKVKINLKTGRHHQIRVSFSHIKHPLVGDIKYGSRYKEDLSLTAYKLSFYHPITKELLVFEV